MKLEKLITKISKIKISERTLVNLAAKIVVWLAPIPTAYLTTVAMIDDLKWPLLIASAAGAVTEALGIIAVDTALTFRRHNQAVSEKHKHQHSAPFLLAIIVFGVYIAGLIVMTIVIDTVPGLVGYAPLAFIIYSTSAYITIGMRNDHEQRVEEMVLSKIKPYAGKKYQEIRKRLLEDGVAHSEVSEDLPKAPKKTAAEPIEIPPPPPQVRKATIADWRKIYKSLDSPNGNFRITEQVIQNFLKVNHLSPPSYRSLTAWVKEAREHFGAN